jgi:hypothetical protein
MREAEMRSFGSTSDVLINCMLIRAAKSKRKKTRIEKIISVRRSYRIVKKIRLPKQVLDVGHATVGIHARRSIKDITAMQMVVFHLPRGANRSCLKALIAISIPKTKVINPMRKRAGMVSFVSLPERLLRHTWEHNHR